MHAFIMNKWVRIGGFSDGLQKALHDFEGANLFGYVYIDHTAGVTLEVIKLFDVKEEELIFKTSPIDKNIRVICRLDAIVKSAELFMVSEEELKKYNLVYPEYLSGYERNDLNAFRLKKEYHAFRGEGYPDDVQVLLMPANEQLQPELIWTRVEQHENGQIKGRLLNQPHQNLGVQLNDMISASFQEMNGKHYITCELKDTPKKKKWWKLW